MINPDYCIFIHTPCKTEEKLFFFYFYESTNSKLMLIGKFHCNIHKYVYLQTNVNYLGIFSEMFKSDSDRFFFFPLEDL